LGYDELDIFLLDSRGVDIFGFFFFLGNSLRSGSLGGLSLLNGFCHLLSGHFSSSLLGVLNSSFTKNNPAVSLSEHLWRGDDEEKGLVLSENDSVDSFDLLESEFLKSLLDLSLSTGRLALAFWCCFSLESWSSLDRLLRLI